MEYNKTITLKDGRTCILRSETEKAGFTEFGRNPRGFRSRLSGYQELVYMRLEL